AIREVEELGFIETHRGRGGNAEYRSPNLFRLTFEPTKDADPTNEWKRYAQGADPDTDAKMMVEAAAGAAMARKNQDPKLVARMKNLATKNKIPVRKTHTGAGAENPHRKPKFSVRKTHTENPIFPVRKTHTTIEIPIHKIGRA